MRDENRMSLLELQITKSCVQKELDKEKRSLKRSIKIRKQSTDEDSRLSWDHFIHNQELYINTLEKIIKKLEKRRRRNAKH